MDTSELVCLTKSFVVNYGLNRFEGVVFIPDDWATERDICRGRKTYKAIAYRVTKGHYGEIEVKAGKEFREVGRMFDLSVAIELFLGIHYNYS